LRASDIVDRAFLVELNTRVKATISTEDVHIGLAIVALVTLINLGLRQHDQTGAMLIPLQLNFVAFKKGLL